MRPASPLILAAATLALAAPAAGASSIADDITAAHHYWGSNVCDARWQIVPDATLAAQGFAGLATGIGFTWDGGGWDWHIERCEFSMNPELQGCERQRVVRHEIGHFIHGPGHDGQMAPAMVDDAPCTIARSVSARTKRKRSSRAAMRARVLKRWRAAKLVTTQGERAT